MSNEVKLYSEEDVRKKYEAMGFTGDELELMVSTDATCATVEMIPDDAKAFVDKIDKALPADEIEGVRAIAEIAEKDPEFAKQMFAFASLLDTAEEPEEKASVGKVDLATIRQEQADAKAEEIIDNK